MARWTGRTPAARTVAIVAVMLLAVAVGILAVIAYQRANTPFASQNPQAVPTFDLGVGSPAPTPTATTEPPPEFPRSSERFLTAVGGTLWRATAGACGGTEPLVERSNDGGESWTDVTPGYLGIAQVASLDGLAVEAVEAVTAVDGPCAAVVLRSWTNGEFWESYPDVLAISRYVDLTDPGTVHMNTGSVAAPCAVAHGLRALRDTVALVCDRVAYVWRNGQWARLPGADAAAVAIAGSDVISAHVTKDCPGLTLTRFTAGDPGTASSAGCAEVTDAGSPAALVASGDGFLVWSGADFVQSSLVR